MWFKLIGDERLGRCATVECGGQPTYRLEAGGVGSNYCSGCYSKYVNLDEPAEVTIRRDRDEWRA